MEKNEVIKGFVEACHLVSEENIQETLGKVRFMIDLLIQEGVFSILEVQNKTLMARIGNSHNSHLYNYSTILPNYQKAPSIWEAEA